MEKKPQKNKALSKDGVEDKKKSQAPVIVPGQWYTFVGNGTFHSLAKGQEFQVSSEEAELFLKKGYGDIK